MRSRAHVGASIQCLWCEEWFVTASGLAIHLESGRCADSGLDRQKINTMVHSMDHNNIITKPVITLPNYDDVECLASEQAWNGDGYECYLCHRSFNRLSSLNQHLKSPAHEMRLYHCPGKACGREYKNLSGLIMHIESESCGLMRFTNVQQQARNGVASMVGKMIGGL